VALPVPEPGLVISYSYLWQSEFAGGWDQGPALRDHPHDPERSGGDGSNRGADHAQPARKRGRSDRNPPCRQAAAWPRREPVLGCRERSEPLRLTGARSPRDLPRRARAVRLRAVATGAVLPDPRAGSGLRRDAAARHRPAHGVSGGGRHRRCCRRGCIPKRGRSAAHPGVRREPARGRCQQAPRRPNLPAGLHPFKEMASPVIRQSVISRNPPGEAIRGPSSSSTTLDPEPTAQTDP
jgi:hypothetical protein